MPEPSTESDSLDMPVDDILLTPLFHDDPGTSSSSNSSGSPPRHEEDWSLPSFLSSPSSITPTSPSKHSLLMDDFTALGSIFHPNWPSLDLDTTMSSFITDEDHHQQAIDPTNLHYAQHHSYSDQSAPVPIQQQSRDLFHFTLTRPLEEVSQLPTPTPASTTSTSSNSRDNSPEPNSSSHSEQDSFGSINPSELDLYAQRAKQATGILMAVRAPSSASASAPVNEAANPGTLHLSQNMSLGTGNEQLITPVSPVLNESQIPNPTAKIPIPRLRATFPNQALQQPTHAIKSDVLVTPSLSHQSSPQIQLQAQPGLTSTSTPASAQATQPLTKSGRPKTSHTTIERRYRTNLNARILALKRAVPALRILEKTAGSEAASGLATQGKGLTGAYAPKWDFNDVINERGYVDGVKAAKKNSKGVVLGKAVEYIRALKRREIRLKRDADGLRALISSLVGGPELLKEWETDWYARFGGDEQDEVEEGEGAVGDDECEDGVGEDGEEEEEEEEESGGARARKRRRGVGPTGSSAAVSGAAAPHEKRKRGRPRKNPPPATGQVSTASSGGGAIQTYMQEEKLMLQPQGQQQYTAQGQGQVAQGQSTYYLAGVLLFNFLWSSPSSSTTSTTSTHTHTHEGTVLSHSHSHAATRATVDSTTLLGFHVPSTSTWGTREYVNFFALLAVLLPLLKVYIGLLLPALFGRERGQCEKEREAKLKKMFVAASVQLENEELRNDVDVEKLLSVGQGLNVCKAVLKRLVRGRSGEVTRKPGEDVLVQVWAWRTVTQRLVLRPNVPFFTRIHAYLRLSALVHAFPGLLTANDAIVLSLLIKPFSLSNAVVWWSKAEDKNKEAASSASSSNGAAVGEEVLESIVLGVGLDSAAEIVAASYHTPAPSSTIHQESGERIVRTIASAVLKDWLGDLARRGFVDIVNGCTNPTTTANGVAGSGSLVHDEDVPFVKGVRVLAATSTSSEYLSSKVKTEHERDAAGWRDVMKLLEGVLTGCVECCGASKFGFTSGPTAAVAQLDHALSDLDVEDLWSGIGANLSSDDASSTTQSEDDESVAVGASHVVSASCLEGGDKKSSSGQISIQGKSQNQKQTRMFLLATLLYLRITSSSAVGHQASGSSAPPTTTAAEQWDTLKLTLRRTLASEVFDADRGVEEARDKVVDMLDEIEGRW